MYICHPSCTGLNDHAYDTLQRSIPPIFLSTHSLDSIMPLSVVRYKHSPGLVKPFTYPACLPLTICPRPSISIHILLVGLLIIFISLRTGSLFQYFNPSHSLLVATLACVTGSGTYEERSSIGGGVKPPRVTEERKPECCSARRRERCRLVDGTEVRPNRAFEAFCRCEHTCARFTRDMVRGIEGFAEPARALEKPAQWAVVI